MPQQGDIRTHWLPVIRAQLAVPEQARQLHTTPPEEYRAENRAMKLPSVLFMTTPRHLQMQWCTETGVLPHAQGAPPSLSTLLMLNVDATTNSIILWLVPQTGFPRATLNPRPSSPTPCLA